MYVCYSSVDSKYHFYYLSDHFVLDTAQEVVDKMYLLFDYTSASKIADLFPEFEIIDVPKKTDQGSLEECIQILKGISIDEKKKKDTNSTKFYDPHLAKLKKMEHERKERTESRCLESKVTPFSKFFKKKG